MRSTRRFRSLSALASVVVIVAACGDGAGEFAAPRDLARCRDVPPISTEVMGDGALENLDPVVLDALVTHAEEHEGVFGGFWIDREAFGTVVVVEVEFTEAELTAAIRPAIDAARTVLETPVGGGLDVRRNRVAIDLPEPVTADDLAAVADAIAASGDISPDMVCWSGLTADEAPPAIEPGTPLDVIRLPSDDGAFPDDVPVTCNGVEFELSDLVDLTASTDVEPDLRRVLEAWIDSAEGRFGPQDGWFLLHEDGERAHFVHLGDDGTMSFVDAEMGPNGWIWSGSSSGEACDVRFDLPPGIGDVEWELDPDAPTPAPDDTAFDVVVTERACASGRELGDRLLGPQVVITDDSVLIAFGAISLAGDQDCPSNPPTRVTITLDEALGEREIRDGLALLPIEALIDHRSS